MIRRTVITALCLLCLVEILAQKDIQRLSIPEYIRERYTSYCADVRREDIYVNTDRAAYIAGEDIWFSIYCTDRRNMTPSASRLAYFEVLTPGGNPVIQKRILLNNGTGFGHAVLPDTLGSGDYVVRCYTGWMKNFLPRNCFLSKIAVHNALRKGKYRKITGLIEESTGKSRIDKPGINVDASINEGYLYVQVRADEDFNLKNRNTVYLMVHSRGNILRLSTERTGQVNRITMPADSLLPGINQVTIFDSEGPVADRFVKYDQAHSSGNGLTAPDSTGIRELISVSLEPPADAGSGMLSITASLKCDNPGRAGFAEYLISGSEFGPDPFRRLSGQPLLYADSILKNLQSDWIIWDSVFSTSPRFFRHLQEKEYHYITGRLIDSSLAAAPEGEAVLFAAPGIQAGFAYSRTSADGSFRIKVPVSGNLQDIIIRSDPASNAENIIIDPSYIPAGLSFLTEDLDSKLPTCAARAAIGYQVMKIFGNPATSPGPDLPGLPPLKKSFYGKPDYVVRPGDYVKLDSLQEVFFELVQGVSLVASRRGYSMIITGPSGLPLEGKPYLMVDGVPVKDPGLVSGIDPGLIDRIEVVKERYRVGGYVFNGIVNIISKTGDFTLFPIPSGTVRLHYRVLDSNDNFNSPDYNNPEKRKSSAADYRNTLYWNPSMSPGKGNIEFWSDDSANDYEIGIEGFLNGKPVSFRKNLVVRRKN